MITYGSGIGIGSGSKIFLPPLSNNAAMAAFLRIFFFAPASAPFGTKAAITIATMAKMAKTLKYFILNLLFGVLVLSLKLSWSEL